MSQGEVEQHHLVEHTLRVADAVLTDSGVVECFLTTEIFGSINVTVRGEWEDCNYLLLLYLSCISFVMEQTRL